MSDYTGIISNVSRDFETGKFKVTLTINEDFSKGYETLRDKPCSIAIKVVRRKRSLDANAYYWTLVTKIAERLHVSKPYVHNTMLRRYGQIEYFGEKVMYVYLRESDEIMRQVDESETYHLAPTTQIRLGLDNVEYRTYKMLRGSHTYNGREMSRLIDGIVEEAKGLGVETMTPDEISRMMAVYGRAGKEKQDETGGGL